MISNQACINYINALFTNTRVLVTLCEYPFRLEQAHTEYFSQYSCSVFNTVE
jgi:hypothetical protein